MTVDTLNDRQAGLLQGRPRKHASGRVVVDDEYSARTAVDGRHADTASSAPVQRCSVSRSLAIVNGLLR